MSIKEKLTNKQTSALGIKREDNGENLYEEKRRKSQKKNDNVKPH
ncbi:hypothetical protein [Clostridium muellerianum]|nr:hypothetical protein [Clostridium muellerianum]